jgi:7-carboxy-7-deazaguanine synthase
VPAIFIRLQGCPVGCAWCDTKHTWDKLADREVSLFSILAKTKESDKWGPASSEDLLAIIGRQGWTARHVVITGGEPCIHDLTPLTSLLEQNGFSCQIETSGTHEVRCSHNTWVTVSPKVNMRGGYDVLSQALQRADEIKHPVGRVRDIEALDELLETLSDDKPRIIALQPISQKRRDASVYRHLYRPQLALVDADAQISEYCLIFRRVVSPPGVSVTRSTSFESRQRFPDYRG